MPFRPIDPLTDRPREPDEFRRLDLDLEQDRSGATMMWPWIVGILGLIVVVALVYGFPSTLSTTSTTGAAPTSVSKINPLGSAPSPAPTTPSPDSTPH